MPTFTPESIESLVTDPGSLRDGRALANTGRWTAVASTEQAAWGLIQGSGKEPYRVALDLGPMASKCTCPSRKFPCKHAVGLMFLLASSGSPAGTPPDWVAAWLESRGQRTAAPQAPPAESAAQLKRLAAREESVRLGVQELRLWLEDLARIGLSDPRVKSHAFWDAISGRMVDAKMGPIGRRLRRLGEGQYSRRADWLTRMTSEIGKLYVLTEAYQRIETLPLAVQQDVRVALGFAPRQEEVLGRGEHVRDTWVVVGQGQDYYDKLHERRTWLFGMSARRFALILDYSPMFTDFSTTYALGSAMLATAVYYPSAYPQRALIAECESMLEEAPSLAEQPPHASVADVLEQYASALAQQPLLEHVPVGMVGRLDNRGLWDGQGTRLPLGRAVTKIWSLAVTADRPVPIFGEWDGESLRVCAAVGSDGWSAAAES